MMPSPDSSNTPEIDILVEAGAWAPESHLRPLVERAVAAALADAAARLAKATELSLVFTDDAHAKLLNRRYRQKDSATNVLSFPAPPAATKMFGPLLGDLVFAHETIVREAAADGLALDDHLSHLVVHGLLHLLGYDHESEEEAAVMEGLETAILAGLGIADPYGGGDG